MGRPSVLATRFLAARTSCAPRDPRLRSAVCEPTSAAAAPTGTRRGDAMRGTTAGSSAGAADPAGAEPQRSLLQDAPALPIVVRVREVLAWRLDAGCRRWRRQFPGLRGPGRPRRRRRRDGDRGAGRDGPGRLAEWQRKLRTRSRARRRLLRGGCAVDEAIRRRRAGLRLGRGRCGASDRHRAAVARVRLRSGSFVGQRRRRAGRRRRHRRGRCRRRPRSRRRRNEDGARSEPSAARAHRRLRAAFACSAASPIGGRSATSSPGGGA